MFCTYFDAYSTVQNQNLLPHAGPPEPETSQAVGCQGGKRIEPQGRGQPLARIGRQAQPEQQEKAAAKDHQEHALLLHQEGDSHQETAGEGLPPAARLQVPPEQIGPRQAEEGDKMRGVRRHAQAGRADREDRVGHGRHAGRKGIEKLAHEAVQQHDRGHVHGQQSQVDAGGRLPEDGHQGRVRDIGPRQFHVVGELVGRHALQDQLPGVGEFAFVALQGKLAEPNSHIDGKDQGNGQQGPSDEIDDSRTRRSDCHWLRGYWVWGRSVGFQ